jgi:release factor glutamine methyltransferase
LALFVADDDPLIFYKKIAQIAQHCLVADGGCFMEINEQYGTETKQLFEEKSFQLVQLLQDIHGKERFVGAFNTHLPN